MDTRDDVITEPQANKRTRKRPSPLFAIFISPFFFWALFHAIATRTTEQFIKYSLYIAAPFFLIALVVSIITFKPSSNRWTTAKELAGTLLPFALATPLIGAMYYAVGASIKDLFLWIKSPDASQFVAISLTIIITLGLGAACFYFRLRMRSLYGVTETIVGLLIAGNKIASVNLRDQMTESSFYLAILTAGVYLVVRGIDNVHQGLTKEPRDEFTLDIIYSLRTSVRNILLIWERRNTREPGQDSEIRVG